VPEVPLLPEGLAAAAELLAAAVPPELSDPLELEPLAEPDTVPLCAGEAREEFPPWAFADDVDVW
jgi:hypothetical protein